MDPPLVVRPGFLDPKRDETSATEDAVQDGTPRYADAAARWRSMSECERGANDADHRMAWKSHTLIGWGVVQSWISRSTASRPRLR